MLMLFVMTAFIDLAVYQIYKQDIENTELTSMQDANEILSDNIRNLIVSIEENLMNEIGRLSVGTVGNRFLQCCEEDEGSGHADAFSGRRL